MQYSVQYFRSQSTGKMFHAIEIIMEGTQECDWRGYAISIETGELMFAPMYPLEIHEEDFAAVLNRRYMRNDLRTTTAIMIETDKDGFFSKYKTKYRDIYDADGYAMLVKETSVREFVEAGGRLTVYGPPIDC